MKIRITIPVRDDREKLIGLLGMNGIPAISVVVKPDPIWGDTHGLEIDITDPPKEEEV